MAKRNKRLTEEISPEATAPFKSRGIEELALRKISEAKQDLKVETLIIELSQELGYTHDRIVSKLIELKNEGKIKLLPKSLKRTFPSYVLSPNSFWFLASVVATAIAFLSIYITSGGAIYVRYVFGALLTIILPGYSLVQLLFPKKWKEDDAVFRVALSIGLSLAVIPLLALALNFSPWGIRLLPIAAATAGFTFVVLFAGVWKRYSHYKMLNVDWMAGE